MLNNLQMARPGQQQGGDGDDEMKPALDELGDMIRRQQQLRDRTFRRARTSAASRASNADSAARRARRVSKAKRANRASRGRKASRVSKAWATCAISTGAARAAQEAVGGVAQARARPAGPARRERDGSARPRRRGDGRRGRRAWRGQCRRRGRFAGPRARSAAPRRAEPGAVDAAAAGQGPGPGQPGGIGQARAQQETDPLGRPLRGATMATTTLPNSCLQRDRSASGAPRAEEILEELRRRFGENFRPQLELDYIERLLRDIR